MNFYSSAKVKPLDIKRKGIICTYLHKRYNDSNRNHKLPIPYLDKIFSFNEIFCWKCGEIISIGSLYNSSSHSNGDSVRKYYHRSCYESMFY